MKFNPASIPAQDRPTRVVLRKTDTRCVLFSMIPSTKGGRLPLDDVPLQGGVVKESVLDLMRKTGVRYARTWNIEFTDETR